MVMEEGTREEVEEESTKEMAVVEAVSEIL